MPMHADDPTFETARTIFRTRTLLGGAAGTAEPLDLTKRGPNENPETVATIAAYLLTLPAGHPAWSQYLLYAVHLRDFPDQTRPPHRKRPDASHEISMVALNPELGQWTAHNFLATQDRARRASKGWWLDPFNYVEQFAGLTDQEAEHLAYEAARGFTRGMLVPEPSGVEGARAYFQRYLDRCLTDYREIVVETASRPSALDGNERGLTKTNTLKPGATAS